MKAFILSTLLALVLQCNGDISESINQQLPLNSLARIPSPAQTLLPPSFENPIKDYTVGLIPPPVDKPLTSSVIRQNRGHQPKLPEQTPSHIPTTRLTKGSRNTAGQYRNTAQHRSGNSAVYHQTHQSTNLAQPQVYQPKMAIYQQYQQPATHHHLHQHNQRHHHPSHSPGFVRQPATQYHSHVMPTSQHYEPVTQSRVHQQHSTRTHYASIPVQRPSTLVQHAHPSVQKPTFVSRTVSSPSDHIIQTYPSVSYEATRSLHGSTLNFGNAKLDPELIHIVHQVVGQFHS